MHGRLEMEQGRIYDLLELFLTNAQRRHDRLVRTLDRRLR